LEGGEFDGGDFAGGAFEGVRAVSRGAFGPWARATSAMLSIKATTSGPNLVEFEIRAFMAPLPWIVPASSAEIHTPGSAPSDRFPRRPTC
jgi:hypothetical protein